MSLICQKRIAVSMVVTENIFSVWLSIRLTPPFSTLAICSRIFHSLYFPPLHFPPPAFSTPAFFDRIAFSTPAFSVAPLLFADHADSRQCTPATHGHCHAHATCTQVTSHVCTCNPAISYRCQCNTGYTGDGLTCEGVLVF